MHREEETMLEYQVQFKVVAKYSVKNAKGEGPGEQHRQEQVV